LTNIHTFLFYGLGSKSKRMINLFLFFFIPWFFFNLTFLHLILFRIELNCFFRLVVYGNFMMSRENHWSPPYKLKFTRTLFFFLVIHFFPLNFILYVRLIWDSTLLFVLVVMVLCACYVRNKLDSQLMLDMKN